MKFEADGSLAIFAVRFPGPSDVSVSNNHDPNTGSGGNFGYIVRPYQGDTPRQGQVYFRISF